MGTEAERPSRSIESILGRALGTREGQGIDRASSGATKWVAQLGADTVRADGVCDVCRKRSPPQMRIGLSSTLPEVRRHSVIISGAWTVTGPGWKSGDLGP